MTHVPETPERFRPKTNHRRREREEDATLQLKKLRMQAGETQADMADMFGVGLSTWQRWEKDPGRIDMTTWQQIVYYLTLARHIKKEAAMPKHLGHVEVDFLTPEEAEAISREYTVPIPEGLTRDFEPSKPVTDEQVLKFAMSGVEPYEGYEEEYIAWERAWEEVNAAQDEADGDVVPEMPTVHVSPEYDEETGLPITYDELHVEETADGDAKLLIDEADLKDEENAD